MFIILLIFRLLVPLPFSSLTTFFVLYLFLYLLCILPPFSSLAPPPFFPITTHEFFHPFKENEGERFLALWTPDKGAVALRECERGSDQRPDKGGGGAGQGEGEG